MYFKRQLFVISCLISLFCIQVRAQEDNRPVMHRFRLGIEVGLTPFTGETNKPEMIRESRSYYYYNNHQDNLFYCGFISNRQSFNIYYLGIRPEYFFSNRIAVSTGIRLSFNNIQLDSDRDFFLWRLSEDETSSNYIRLNNISQKNRHIDVITKIKFFPGKRNFWFRRYYVLGNTLNILATSSNGVSVHNPEMNIYSQKVLEQIGKPSVLMGYTYVGLGINIGSITRSFGSIEFQFPAIIHGSENLNSLVTKGQRMNFFRMLATLQIPIGFGDRLIDIAK